LEIPSPHKSLLKQEGLQLAEATVVFVIKVF
jgi:hypothetical protein